MSVFEDCLYNIYVPILLCGRIKWNVLRTIKVISQSLFGDNAIFFFKLRVLWHFDNVFIQHRSAVDLRAQTVFLLCIKAGYSSNYCVCAILAFKWEKLSVRLYPKETC